MKMPSEENRKRKKNNIQQQQQFETKMKYVLCSRYFVLIHIFSK